MTIDHAASQWPARGRRAPLPSGPWRMGLLLPLGMGPVHAHAHVKWFSNVVNCSSTPLSPGSVLTHPLFLALWLAAALTLCAVFTVERRILPHFETLHQAHADWKQRFSRHSAWLLRIGVAVYFLSLFTHEGPARIVLTPELKTSGTWVGAVQLAIAVLVLWKRTVPLAIAGMLSLYAHGVWSATATVCRCRELRRSDC